jgi:hypothetical protein
VRAVLICVACVWPGVRRAGLPKAGGRALAPARGAALIYEWADSATQRGNSVSSVG